MQHFQVLPDLQKIKTYTNPTKPNLTKVLGATISMPSLGGKPPEPPNQGIQSDVLFGDLEIRRGEILYIFISRYLNILFRCMNYFRLKQIKTKFFLHSGWLVGQQKTDRKSHFFSSPHVFFIAA